MAGRAHSVPPLTRLLRVRCFARASPADRPAIRRVPPALCAGSLQPLETKTAMSGLGWSRRDVPPRRDQPGLPLRFIPANPSLTILEFSSSKVVDRPYRRVDPADAQDHRTDGDDSLMIWLAKR